MIKSFRGIPGRRNLSVVSEPKRHSWPLSEPNTPEIVTKGDLTEIKVTWFCLGILAGIVAGVCL